MMKVCLEQEPVLPGSVLRVRPIGLMPMIDQVYKYINQSHLCINNVRKPKSLEFDDHKLSAENNKLQGEKDDKLIAVCADDPEYKHYNDIKQLAPHRLTEIRSFFEDCKYYLIQLFQLLHLQNSNYIYFTN